MAVAEAVAWTMNQNETAEQWLMHLPTLGHDEEWLAICHKLTDALASRKSVAEFADSLGLQNGITGYTYHSVPIALYACLRHCGNFRSALTNSLDCGGDTDTVGAIVGAIMGAHVGKQGIPPKLIAGIAEWPRSVSFLDQVAAKLAQQTHENKSFGPVGYFWPGLILRNVLFLIVVLIHGFRRLAPPY